MTSRLDLHLDGVPSGPNCFCLVARAAVLPLRVLPGQRGELGEGRTAVQRRVTQGQVPDRPGSVPGVPAERGGDDAEGPVRNAGVQVDVAALNVMVHVRGLLIVRV